MKRGDKEKNSEYKKKSHHFIFDHVAVCKPLWYEIVDANLCKLFVNS
jgi:hypothetical protein